MQSRRGGPRKKFKCTIKDLRDTLNESANSDVAITALAEVMNVPVNSATSVSLYINFSPIEEPVTNSPTAETITEMTLTPAKDHLNTKIVLHTFAKDTLTSEPVLQIASNLPLVLSY
jgi:hypothetical protein